MADPDTLMSAPPGVDRDAGSDNTISGTVDGAVAASAAHYGELESDTLIMGHSVGDALPLPANPVSVNYGSALNPASTDWPPQAQEPAQQGGS